MYSEKPTSLYYRWCPSSVQTDPRLKRLNLKQHGFYRLLLDAMWQHDMAKIEDSYEACRFWIPVDRRDWKEITDMLVSVGLLHRDNGFLRSPELEREASAAYSKSKHASKSVRTRWDKHAESLDRADTDVIRTNYERNTPILSNPIQAESNKPPKSPRKPDEQFEVPSWVPSEPWADFCELRISRNRKTWTLGAKKRTIAELAKLRNQGHDPGDVLNQSVQRGWMGVFPLKAHHQPKGGNDEPEVNPEEWERAWEAEQAQKAHRNGR